MLVLSRQRDETIMIGDDIEITVVDIRGDKVRLGITAPARVAVHRKEVYDAIKAENEQASRATGELGSLQRLAPTAVRPGGRAASLVAGTRPPDPQAAEPAPPRPAARKRA
ncbi:MAG: carbon storage regulator CsrA [Phycisphaerales bacterium]|nr:carbon storage regulator CsrA [Phycisphaerales bacterium]